MVEQITSGIKIQVETNYQGSFYKNQKTHYAFGYQITIKNQSNNTVQLNTRHWIILDALNHTETVSGEGVIGKKPILLPNESHTYNSGCLLTSPIGAMKGYYQMINLVNNKPFNVEVPLFKLSTPYILN